MDRLGDLACALNSIRTGDAVGTDAMASAAAARGRGLLSGRLRAPPAPCKPHIEKQACPPEQAHTPPTPNPSPQLGELRGAAEAVVQARRRVQLQGAALQELKGSYVAGGEPTDFAAHLAQRAQAAGDAQP